MSFDVLELPDLYGPVTIFQRFRVFNDANGGYRVSLNGEVLHEAEGLDTRAST